jgi:hypothetical protein
MGGGGVNIEARNKWIFGNPVTAAAAGEGGASLGTTGTGTRFFVGGVTRFTSFYVEASLNASCSFQILTARTETGPSAILSSGTLSSNALAVVQSSIAPLAWVMPRLKTLTSTSVHVIVELYGN